MASIGGMLGGKRRRRSRRKSRRGGATCNSDLANAAPVGNSVTRGGRRGGSSVLPAWALLGTNLLVGPGSHKKGKRRRTRKGSRKGTRKGMRRKTARRAYSKKR